VTGGWLAIAGALAAVVLTASRPERLIERFWTKVLRDGWFLPSLLAQLEGIEHAISFTRTQVQELRSARRTAEADRVADAGKSFARDTRDERRALARLRRVVRT
jgi:hypothetical protein